MDRISERAATRSVIIYIPVVIAMYIKNMFTKKVKE